MVKNMILVNRDVLLTELYTVFDAHTAETLLHVLDNVAEQVHSAGVSREDFSELKQIVARIGEKLEKLAEMHQQTEELMLRRLDQHGQRLTNIETDVKTLKGDVKTLKGDVKTLKSDVKTLKDDVGKLKGYALETRYRDRVASYFGRLLRRPKVVDLNSLVDDLEAHLSSEEFEQLLPLDLLVVGKPKQQPQAEKLYLAIEISSVVDKKDVQRAQERADLLCKAGYNAIPVAAGEEITEGAEPAARQHHVVMLLNGRTLFWQEALAQ